MEQGRIKRLLKDKGFGFISTEQDTEVYFDKRVVHGTAFDALMEGEPVLYRVNSEVVVPEGKHPRANYVKSLKAVGR